ncbi:lmo0937 family membrane protein, partial [Vibrio parahaemolyticus]
VGQLQGRKPMFIGLAIILLIAWVAGFLVFHVAGALIHLLLLLAAVSFVFQLISGGRKTAP